MMWLKKLGLKDFQKISGIAVLLIAAIFLCTAIVLFTMASSKYKAHPQRGDSILTDGTHSPGSTAGPGENSVQMNYLQISAEYAGLTPNSEAWTNLNTNPEEDGLYCISQKNERFCVYLVDSADVCGEGYVLQDFSYMWINSEDDHFYAVVNLSGRVVDLSGFYILVRDESGVYASRVVINCYEAEEVILKDTILTGTLLAPRATVIYDNTSVYGQVISASASGKLFYHRDIKFTGYETFVDSLDSVEFLNDGVRTAALRYLIEHNPGGAYAKYDYGSPLKTADLEKVAALKLDGQELVNLEADLEHFPNLLELSVKNTNLTELNLSVVPNLTALSYGGTQMPLPDVTKTPRLTYLDCSGTGLTELDGTLLPMLTTLVISDNPLTSFSLQDYPALIALDCSDCALTVLSFAGCENLKYFKGSGNLFTEIDFTAAEALRQIEVYGSGLERIDVTGLTVERLYCDQTVQIVNGPAEETEA